MGYMDLFHQNMKKKQFSRSDVKKIQEEIISSYRGYEQAVFDAENDYISGMADADYEKIKMSNAGYDPDEVSPDDIANLPAFVGVIRHPDEIEREAAENRDLAIGNAEETKKELFENVYEISRTNMQGIRIGYAPNSNLHETYGSSVIVTSSVTDVLGDEYAEFADKKFREYVEDVRKEQTGKAVSNKNSFETLFSDNQDTKNIVRMDYIFNRNVSDAVHNAVKKANMETAEEGDHYDSIYNTLRDERPELNKTELDYVTEHAHLGTYDKECDKFHGITNKPAGVGFLVSYSDDYNDKLAGMSEPEYASHVSPGKKLCSHIDEIKETLGEMLGIEEGFEPEIMIDNSLTSGFTVAYPNTNAVSNPEDVKRAVSMQLSDMGYHAADFSYGNAESLPAYQMEMIKQEFGKTMENIGRDARISDFIPKSSLDEIRHVEQVMREGFGDGGYNSDGFDDTGHSADGDYNPMYDKAYTDSGPDF